jgi:hypothetical protein
MSKRRPRREEKTIHDPDLGAVRVRALSRGQMRSVIREIERVDLDAVAAEAPALAHLPLAERREQARETLSLVAVLKRAVIDVEIRQRLDLDSPAPEISPEDGDALFRLGSAVVALSSGGS